MDSIVFPTLPTYLFESSLAGVLSLVLTVILPIVAALLMKSRWSALQKGLVLLFMAAVKAFLEAWIGAATSDEVFQWADTLYSVLINFGIAVVAYVGLWKGTSVQQSALATGVTDTPRPIH
jgi:cell shape-determining protein MreD